MSPEQFEAIKKFKEGIETCLLETLKTYEHDNLVDRAMSCGLNYGIKILDLHLRIAELDANKEMEKMASFYGE